MVARGCRDADPLCPSLARRSHAAAAFRQRCSPQEFLTSHQKGEGWLELKARQSNKSFPMSLVVVKSECNVGNSIFLSFLHHSHFLCFISHIEALCTTTIMGMNFKRIINFTLFFFFFLSLTFSLSRKYFRSLEP